MTGAQGTGKSILTRAVCDALRDAGVTDVRRYVGLGTSPWVAGLRLGVRADAETVRQFAYAHITRESSGSGQGQVFDRCLLDTLAYAHVLGCLPHGEFRALTRATVASSARFAQIAWLRVTNDYPASSARDEPADFRRRIDAAIGMLARAHRMALHEHAMSPDSVDDLARRIVSRFLSQRSAASVGQGRRFKGDGTVEGGQPGTR
jgi:predicted ATPase